MYLNSRIAAIKRKAKNRPVDWVAMNAKQEQTRLKLTAQLEQLKAEGTQEPELSDEEMTEKMQRLKAYMFQRVNAYRAGNGKNY